MDLKKAKEIRPGDLMYSQITHALYDIPYQQNQETFWNECKKTIAMPPNTIFPVLEFIPWNPERGDDFFQLKILYNNQIWYMAFGSREISFLCWEWWSGKWETFFKEVEEKRNRKK